jgi:hypothetical protein
MQVNLFYILSVLRSIMYKGRLSLYTYLQLQSSDLLYTAGLE